MPDLDRTFEALGDPTRLAVVRLLRQRPRRSSELADALSLPRPAMSKHLGVLRRAGLVDESRLEDDARGRVYALRRPAIAEARGWLEDVERFWTEQLESFGRHVEATYGRGKP